MNKDYVLFNLTEAVEELQRTIREIQAVPDYSDADYRVAIEHAYHHINHAWNARNEGAAFQCNEEEFYRFRTFPKDIDLSA